MGFDRDLSITALSEADVPTVEGAIDWIMQNNETINTFQSDNVDDRNRERHNNVDKIYPENNSVQTSLKQREEEYQRDFEKKEEEKENMQKSQLSAEAKKESHDSKR